MLDRGHCRDCCSDYRKLKNEHTNIWKTDDGLWAKHCSGCGETQKYTRKDHAKQSHVSDWQCKPCVAKNKKFNANRPVGDRTRVYRRYKKSAFSRGIEWNLTEDQMFASYTGFCDMTGWPISLSYEDNSASLDRIDSSIGYEPDNVQWVHKQVNMSKNRYTQAEFIDMCRAVANKVKW